MAKKRATSAAEAKPKKAAGAVKKATKAVKAAPEVKKAAAPKAPKAPKAVKAAKAPAPAPAPAAAPKKKAAPVKITDKQKELLAKIQGAGELGYKPEKAEARGVNALREKKLVKSVRNKDTKDLHAHLTKVGEKALAPPKA